MYCPEGSVAMALERCELGTVIRKEWKFRGPLEGCCINPSARRCCYKNRKKGIDSYLKGRKEGTWHLDIGWFERMFPELGMIPMFLALATG